MNKSNVIITRRLLMVFMVVLLIIAMPVSVFANSGNGSADLTNLSGATASKLTITYDWSNSKQNAAPSFSISFSILDLTSSRSITSCKAVTKSSTSLPIP